MDIIETLVFLNLDPFWLIRWVFCLFGDVILRGLWKCRGGLCKSLLEIFTHPEQERFITHYSAQVGCLQLNETNPATLNITLQHMCTSVYQLCVCVCVCACLMCLNLLCLIFVFEWVAMCGWYLYAPLFYIYILHCLLPALCVCVIFCIVCIEGLGLWKFNLNWTHYCLEHQAVFIIFYLYLIDSTSHTHSDIIIMYDITYNECIYFCKNTV